MKRVNRHGIVKLNFNDFANWVYTLWTMGDYLRKDSTPGITVVRPDLLKTEAKD